MIKNFIPTMKDQICKVFKSGSTLVTVYGVKNTFMYTGKLFLPSFFIFKILSICYACL